MPRPPVLNLNTTAIFISTFLLSVSASALPTDTPPSTDTQNKQGIQGLSIDLGYQNDTNGNNNPFYYKISYRGKSLGENGVAPKQTDITRQFDVPGTDAKSDTNNFSFTLQQGTGKIDSGIFSSIGVQPLNLSIPGLSSLRGTVQATGKLDGKAINSSVGLETYPISPLNSINKSSNANISNWLLLGINGEHQSSDDGNTVIKNVGLLTYRMFIGKGFGWSYRSTTDPLVNLDKVLKRAGTLMAARNLMGNSGHGTLNETDPTDQQVALTALRSDVSIIQNNDQKAIDSSFWKDKVQRQLVNYAKGYFLEPSSALWFQSSGWYTFSGEPSGSKAKAIYAVTISHWLNNNEENRTQIQLRYENGYDRAAPLVRENRFITTVGVNF